MADVMGSAGPVEPTADQREVARLWRQLFAALLGEGFTEQQALTLIGHLLKSFGGAA